MNLTYINRAKKSFHSFGKHTHDVWEIMLITEGTGEVTVAGSVYPVEPGTILCIPPKTEHSSLSENGMKDFCAGFEDFPIFRKPDLKVLHDGSGDFEKLMDMILHAVYETSLNQKELLDALCNALSQLLIALLDDNDKGMTAVHDLKQVLMDHLQDETFSVGEAMREGDFSEGYLRRLFHEVTGMSPLQWLNMQRVEYAKRTLSQYHFFYSIREVAHMSGFGDPYYFSRAFKKYTGMSPSGYLQSYIEKDSVQSETADERIRAVSEGKVSG